MSSEEKNSQVEKITSEVLDIYKLIKNKGLSSDKLTRLGHEIPEEREKLRKIADKIIQLNPQIVTRELVEQNILFKLFQQALHFADMENSLQTDAKQMVLQLADYHVERDIETPLVLIEVDEPVIAFGNVRFRPYLGEQNKFSWLQTVEQTKASGLFRYVKSYAVTRVEGCFTDALTKAKDRIEEILLYIRGIGYPIDETPTAPIGFFNEFSPSGSIRFEISNQRSNYSLEDRVEKVTRLGPSIRSYNLQTELLAEREIAEKVNQIILNAQKTKMQRKILLALRWLGEATKPDVLSAKYVKACFALEALVGDETRKQKNGLTERIAKRSAFLAGTSEERIRHFYRVRSKIVHGGSQTIDISEFVEFGNLVRCVMFSLLTRLDKLPSLEVLDSRIAD